MADSIALKQSLSLPFKRKNVNGLNFGASNPRHELKDGPEFYVPEKLNKNFQKPVLQGDSLLLAKPSNLEMQDHEKELEHGGFQYL